MMERSLGMEERWILRETDPGDANDSSSDMAETISAVNNFLGRREKPDTSSEQPARPVTERTEDAEDLEEAARLLSGTSLSEEETEEITGMLLALGLHKEEVGRSLSELQNDSERKERMVNAINDAEPFLHPEITEHSVRLHLEGRPVENIRVVIEDNGKYLIVESDNVETRIRLPF